MGFGFSDPDVRRFDELTKICAASRTSCARRCIFGRQYRAAKQMRTHARSKIHSTSGAQIRASTKGIGGSLHHLVLKTARKALRDVVLAAVDEQQGALVGVSA
jgi:hypothetical protein